jgi:hypothetical protein
VAKSTEIQKNDTNVNALARPDWMQPNEGNVGAENIQHEDVQMPRIALAQAQSPQLNPKGDEYIDGLRVSDLFNSLTGEILPKPLRFVVLRVEKPRHIEFNPIEAGGGIKDFNVPPGDPRTQFTTAEDGTREKPVATKFLDYVVATYPLDLNNPMANVLALSFKGTGLKVAKKLNGLVKSRMQPIYRGVYELDTDMKSEKSYTYAIYKVENAGWITQEEDVVFKALFRELAGANINIDRDATDFDPSELE